MRSDPQFDVNPSQRGFAILFRVGQSERWNSMGIEGVNHVTFVVRDLERMAAFLCDGPGAKEDYDSKAKNFSVPREKFFVLGGVWLAAMEGVPPTERSYRHLAFRVSESELPGFEQRLRRLGVEIKAPRPSSHSFWSDHRNTLIRANKLSE